MTPGQCRGARGLLGWSQADLAEKAKVGLSTLGNFEGSKSAMMAANLEAVQRTLESAGVEFIPENGGGPGVRLKRGK